MDESNKGYDDASGKSSKTNIEHFHKTKHRPLLRLIGRQTTERPSNAEQTKRLFNTKMEDVVRQVVDMRKALSIDTDDGTEEKESKNGDWKPLKMMMKNNVASNKLFKVS